MTTTSCAMTTVRGTPCENPPETRGLCHLHEPSMSYALQHPKYRERLLQNPVVKDIVRRHPLMALLARLPTLPPAPPTLPDDIATLASPDPLLLALLSEAQ
jgi:hypothetical protein